MEQNIERRQLLSLGVVLFLAPALRLFLFFMDFSFYCGLLSGMFFTVVYCRLLFKIHFTAIFPFTLVRFT